MVHNILIVDDNQPFLNLITKIFDKYDNKYFLQTCLDGLHAIDLLSKKNFSIVVTDLQMPNMDGYALLRKIQTDFPDIPVIIITAFAKPKTESVVMSTGAVAYFTKPLVMDSLISAIDKFASKETEGGQLHNASLEMFIQLIEMEAKTCTIRVSEETQKKSGVLFFNMGVLFDARYGAKTGKEAAYEVFSWGKVTLSIENSCIVEERKIRDDLQAILLDAMRMKDEKGSLEEDFSEEADKNIIYKDHSDQEDLSQWEEQKSDFPEDAIKKKLSGILNIDEDIVSININAPLDDFIEQSNFLGNFFDFGDMTAAYFDENSPANTIIVANKNGSCVKIVVKKKCFPDKIIKILTE